MIHFAAGIKSTNVLHCLWGSVTPQGRSLDGVSVVSDIVGAQNAKLASQKLAAKINAFYKSPYQTFAELYTKPLTAADLKIGVGQILSAIRKFGPLVHQARIFPSMLPFRSGYVLCS